MIELFYGAPLLVKLCILILAVMSVFSWGLMLMMLWTLRPAIGKLKRRWLSEQMQKQHQSGSNPWISIASHRLQYQLNIIASIAKLSPYIGLLGTVFGIMDALKGLATATSAPIQELAPGISEALTTTALGLLVAIPAMLFHQMLSQYMIELDDYLQLEANK
jgi:biopolymer transport protein ExbB/TolQ